MNGGDDDDGDGDDNAEAHNAKYGLDAAHNKRSIMKTNRQKPMSHFAMGAHREAHQRSSAVLRFCLNSFKKIYKKSVNRSLKSELLCKTVPCTPQQHPSQYWFQ